MISKRISGILESLWMILIVYTLVYVSDCQCVELSSRLHIARSSISQQCPQRVQCLTLRYHIIRLTFTDIIGTSREVNAKRFYVLVNKEADKTFFVDIPQWVVFWGVKAKEHQQSFRIHLSNCRWVLFILFFGSLLKSWPYILVLKFSLLSQHVLCVLGHILSH